MGFREATTLERTGEERWEGEIAAGWDIAGRANGGYLMALASRVLVDVTGCSDPVTVTAHFLEPGRPGPVTAEARALRIGGRFATGSVILSSGGQPMLALLGTCAEMSPADDSDHAIERVDAAPPELPPPEECVGRRPAEDNLVPTFMGRVDLRLHPEDAAFPSQPSGEPRVRGWFRWPDGEPVDSLGLLVAVDAFPPTIFNARLPKGWTPTVELTTHVRARPRGDWLRCAFTTRFITGGFLEEDGEVWDESGRLVAQSRQLALLPRTRP